MADLRILQLIKGLDIGGVNGGAERFSIDLSEQLKNFGYQVDLCAFYKMNTSAEADWLSRLKEKDQVVFFATAWAGPNNVGNFIAGCKALREYAEREKPVVLHSHFQQGTYAAIWLKKKLKIPVVVRTAHNVLEWEPGFLGRVKEVISDFVYPRRLDTEVGVSVAIVEQLSMRYPTHSKKVRPILAYNGILLPSVENPSSATRNAENGFTIGTVGRLAEQKGYAFLVAAMSRILKHHPQTKLIFLGDGELRSQLEAQTRQSGLQNHVEFAGQVDDVLARLQRFDLFVSSSLWEGLPTVIMEAMAVALPVVATDIPGTREIISDGVNGVLVQPGDPVVLADAIIGMIENPQMRQDFGKAGIQSVKKFSIEEIAKTYLELYERLLTGPAKND